MNTIDISYTSLLIVFCVLIIPLFILFYYQTGLLKQAVISIFRMTGQLLFIGIYLKYIFEINHPIINISWALIMVIITSVTIISRSELKQKFFIIPVFLGTFAGIMLTSFFLLFFVLKLKNPYDARYIIPITGMIAGNCLSAAIIGIRSFYSNLLKDEEKYKYYLSCGANTSEALFLFIKNAMRDSFSPAIAQMATIGLISLPGMMTGQILGGSSPLLAIKYQIMIMAAILAGNIITVHLSIFFSKQKSFDTWGNFKKEIFNKNTN
ncbi:MAG: ABC transporter permease [Spirochaetia bacterium]|nr:ABC transporter permease [Spirochaetia bacterium]